MAGLERTRQWLRVRAGRVSADAVWRTLLALLSSWYVGAFMWVAVRRIGYPYDLEWMEGGIYEHVARVLEGKPLYVPPSIDFTPYIYTPLYYWLSAPFVWLLGPGLPALRVLSLLSTLGVFASLYALVRLGTRDRLCGWLALGTFAGCFDIGGAWFDLARVDMLGLLLLALALLCLLRSERLDLLAGTLLALSFLTKQSALFVALPVLSARMVTQRGLRRLYAPLAFGLLFALSTVLLDRASDGWYRYYVFELPASHPLAPQAWRGFWQLDVFAVVPFATACLLFVLAQARPWRSAMLRIAISIGLLGSAWSSRLHTGGYANVLLPALFLLSWAMAEALHTWTVSDTAAQTATKPADRSTARFAYALCMVQLLWLWYPPGAQIPTAADRRAGDQLVAQLHGIRGDVLVPYHGHLARLAGKPAHGHDMAFRDVLLGASGYPKLQLKRSIATALHDRRFTLIVLDEPWWRREIETHYTRSNVRSWQREGALQCRTGMRTGPKDVYVPQSSAAAALGQ